MTLLIIAAVLTGLAVLPFGFRAIYRQSDAGVWVLIGPLKLRVYPAKRKKDDQKEAKGKSHKEKAETQKGGSYRDFLPVIRTVVEFLDHFRRKVRVKRLEMKLTLAGDDPCDLAVHYGQAWAALGSLIPQLERLFVIKKRDLEVLCDFTSDKTVIYARLDATISLGRIVCLLSRHGIKTLKEIFKLSKLRKGGAKI